MKDTGTYEFWESLILRWFQGSVTSPELIRMSSPALDIHAEGWPEIDMVAAFESSLRKLDENHLYRWEQRKEYAKDTAPTVNGLVNNLVQTTEGKQSLENLVEWASWHNMDGGETTSGVFENDRIEYFCLEFLPSFHESLDPTYFKRVLGIVKSSNRLTRPAFICSLFIQLDKERPGMVYVLKDYIRGDRNDADLESYFLKKFGFGTSALPWMTTLRTARVNGNIDLPIVALVANGVM